MLAFSLDFQKRNDVHKQKLSELCTMHIGGEATLVRIECADDIAFLRDHEYRLLGKGANLLIGDADLSEYIVKLGKDFSHCEIREGSQGADTAIVTVGAAYDLARCIGHCVQAGLAGPEGLAGVPATIGGALYMNAGTATCWLFDWVSRVQVLLPDEQTPRWLLRDEVPAVYRSSGLPTGTIFLQCEMELAHADARTLKETASRLKQAKSASQPLSAQSAGCVFKNPSLDIAAGWLIDDLGLKGRRVGDVMVSEIHGNFIVNNGAGTADEVTCLIQDIRKQAWQERGIALALEVQCWHCDAVLQQSAEELFA